MIFSSSMHPTREALVRQLVAHDYNKQVAEARPQEYPQLKGVTYLDHAGATLYATSSINAFSTDLCTNLYGNPHSQSPSSILSTQRSDNVRLRVLQLFKADPEEFDVVFCANATAGMKLVLEAFSAQKSGFRYKYHVDAHTSLVGIRELAKDARCFLTDAETDEWLSSQSNGNLGLFAWPAQSNFTGRRLPLNWGGKLRSSHPKYYSLLDAAAYVTTGTLDLSDSAAAPDFTVLSFYKMFGFPDLGALIVRRASAGILKSRRYFGGGTVDSLVSTKSHFVARKDDAPHSYMEDGTTPFHSIIALDAAMSTHERLYGSYQQLAKHAFSLGKLTYELISNLRHANGRKLCIIYGAGDFSSQLSQGPTLAFNMQRADGAWVGYADVEKLAAVNNIHLRAGGMCNAGAIETYVGLESWEIEQNFAAGHKCSDEMDIIDGKPTGAVRVSFGAMSTVDDVLALIAFLTEFYLETTTTLPCHPWATSTAEDEKQDEPQVESLTIYPIKSCAGYSIPRNVSWELTKTGLKWDREWCLVHLGTGAALSMKSYPAMTFLHPTMDFELGVLHVADRRTNQSLEIPLLVPPVSSSAASSSSDDSNSYEYDLKISSSRVCAQRVETQVYHSPQVVEFFTTAIGVGCTLARLPPNSENTSGEAQGGKNDSPLLVINRSSVKAVDSVLDERVFRANVVISGSKAWEEDTWATLKLNHEDGVEINVQDACRRCRMVCVDPDTGVVGKEPFATLARTRRDGKGRVIFGLHATGKSRGLIWVGGRVRVERKTERDKEGIEPSPAIERKKAEIIEVKEVIPPDRKTLVGSAKDAMAGYMRGYVFS